MSILGPISEGIHGGPGGVDWYLEKHGGWFFCGEFYIERLHSSRVRNDYSYTSYLLYSHVVKRLRRC